MEGTCVDCEELKNVNCNMKTKELLCDSCRRKRKGVRCSICRKRNRISAKPNGKPVCTTCWKKRENGFYLPPTHVCHFCGEDKPVNKRLDENTPVCNACNSRELLVEECGACGNERSICCRLPAGNALCSQCRKEANKENCSVCETLKIVYARKGKQKKPVCRRCYAKE